MGLLGGFAGHLFSKKKPKTKQYAVTCMSFKTFSEDPLFIVPNSSNNDTDQETTPTSNGFEQIKVTNNAREVIKMKKNIQKQDAQDLFKNGHVNSTQSENIIQNGTNNYKNTTSNLNKKEIKKELQKTDDIKANNKEIKQELPKTENININNKEIKKELPKTKVTDEVLTHTNDDNKIKVNLTKEMLMKNEEMEKPPSLPKSEPPKLKMDNSLDYSELKTIQPVEKTVFIQEKEQGKDATEEKLPKSILKSKNYENFKEFTESQTNPVEVAAKTENKEAGVMFKEETEEIPPKVNYSSRPTSIEDYTTNIYENYDFLNLNKENDNVFTKFNVNNKPQVDIADKKEDIVEDDTNNYENIVRKPKTRYSVADTFSSQAASIFFDDYEPEPEQRNRKYLLNDDSDDDGSEASA